MQEATEEAAKKRRAPKWLRKNWVWAAAGAAVVLAVGLLVWQPWASRDTGLIPPSVLGQISDFTPYEPEIFPNSLRVQKSSVKFTNDVLFFRLANPVGKGLTVSEQLSPRSLSDRDYSSFGYEKVDGVDGTAYITRDKTRTFATFFATGQNNRPTMILINTNDPFTSDNLKDLLRSFRVAQ